MFFPPPPGSDTASAVADQLAWFDSTLASAQARGKKVWLLMHIPPGANILANAQVFDSNGYLAPATTTMMWSQDYQTSFLQILSKYPGLITMELAAHTHMDEYRIMAPHHVLELTPGITPRSGNDPAFKVFTFSQDTLTATDYTSLNYDLATTQGQFSGYYTFSTAYNLQGPLNDSLAQLYPLLARTAQDGHLTKGSIFPVVVTLKPLIRLPP